MWCVCFVNKCKASKFFKKGAGGVGRNPNNFPHVDHVLTILMTQQLGLIVPLRTEERGRFTVYFTMLLILWPAEN